MATLKKASSLVIESDDLSSNPGHPFADPRDGQGANHLGLTPHALVGHSGGRNVSSPRTSEDSKRDSAGGAQVRPRLTGGPGCAVAIAPPGFLRPPTRSTQYMKMGQSRLQNSQAESGPAERSANAPRPVPDPSLGTPASCAANGLVPGDGLAAVPTFHLKTSAPRPILD